MSQPTHTYGPGCRLFRSTLSGSKEQKDPPPLETQFFYTSQLPIDDPLSAVPAPTSSESMKYPPRPFSTYDNEALEDAWQRVSNGKDKKRDKGARSPTKGNTSSSPSSTQKSSPFATYKNIHDTEQGAVSAGQHITSLVEAHASGSDKKSNAANAADLNRAIGDAHISMDDNDGSEAGCCDDLEEYHTKPSCDCSQGSVESEAAEEQTNPSCGCLRSPRESDAAQGQVVTRPSCGCFRSPRESDAAQGQVVTRPSCGCFRSSGESEAAQEQDPSEQQKYTTIKSKGKQVSRKQRPVESQGDSSDDPGSNNRPYSLATSTYKEPKSVKKSKLGASSNQDGKFDGKNSGKGQGTGSSQPAPAEEGDAGTTGLPFAKLPSRNGVTQSQAHVSIHGSSEHLLENDPSDNGKGHERDESEVLSAQGCKAYKSNKKQYDVPVGISRLHLVKMPALQMEPIYWSPVRDVSAVTRGTWFYKDSMYPVKPAVANQLESGYKGLKPWSETWNDELNSAMEVGAAGEEKIAYRLWPKEDDQKTSSKKSSQHTISSNPYCAAKCFNGEVAAEGTVADASDENSAEKKSLAKMYPNSQVIYKDSQHAFILKPSLQPSAYYGRKPLRKIKKGTTVGIHVVRGFDRKVWDKLHPSKKSNASMKVEMNALTATDVVSSKGNSCAACNSEDRPQVTDLILVIHGIGQKLSERVESFHFTHAINDFRRSMNVELGNDSVRQVLQKGQHDNGGVMVLPVNWRSNVSLEDERQKKKGAAAHDDARKFSLEDITPETIPAVRSMISDVMVDIPMYMSIHKPKMISALITEANRVYKLWCKNNPEFQDRGRVHIIAHSLGSVMALDVLSKQPTSVPRVNPDKKPASTQFEFNTVNLFLAGSPCAFFLLLEKGTLVPRKGLKKPGADSSDTIDKDIIGNTGDFGCLAVENIYNIIHYSDPIAYRLNATVDPQWAASLKDAQVPSRTSGFLESIASAVRSIAPGASGETSADQTNPPGVAQLPSQVEMDVHNFTREEMAEKKAYLLNDNGQIDWFLSTASGPLEIQYLNMLGAHSSYWTSPDFIRMIVREVCRKPGRKNTLANMRATKIRHKSKK